MEILGDIKLAQSNYAQIAYFKVIKIVLWAYDKHI